MKHPTQAELRPLRRGSLVEDLAFQIILLLAAILAAFASGCVVAAGYCAFGLIFALLLATIASGAWSYVLMHFKLPWMIAEQRAAKEWGDLKAQMPSQTTDEAWAKSTAAQLLTEDFDRHQHDLRLTGRLGSTEDLRWDQFCHYWVTKALTRPSD